MFKKFKKLFLIYFMNLKIKKKLMLTYLILIIIPLGLLTSVSYVKVSEIVQKQTIQSANQVFEQAVFFLDSKIESVINASDVIILEREMNDIFKRLDVQYDVPQQVKDLDKMTSFFRGLIKNKDIYGIQFYVPEGLIFSRDEVENNGENIDFLNIENIKNDEWYKSLRSFNGKIMWCSSKAFSNPIYGRHDIVSGVRLIKNPFKLNEYIGVLKIDLKESEILDILKKSNITENGVVYLENSSGVLLSSSSSDSADKWAAEIRNNQVIPAEKPELLNINGDEVIIGLKNIENTDWRMVSVIPLGEILASTSVKLKNFMFILMILIGIVAYVLAYYVSNSSTRRIQQLARVMREVQGGRLDVEIASSSRDEIGELTDDFNFMIKRMAEMVEERFRIGQEVKNAEFKALQSEHKALQAQINPHFLYNTLDLINWIAIQHNIPEIEHTVKALSKFYKLSLSKGRDIVSIEDEIAHARTYVQIQNLRFDNGIRLEININEALYKYKTLKIILQPLVENSILHGIMRKPQRSGNIKITGVLESEILVLRLKDDGVGIPEDRISSILTAQSTDQIHGYGVRNINERIKLYFGNHYGLSYESTYGEGTTVEIRLPAMQYEQ